jgi:hypothetical protein
MKHTARLYLPWSVVSAFLESVVGAAEVQPKHRDKPQASVELFTRERSGEVPPGARTVQSGSGAPTG